MLSLNVDMAFMSAAAEHPTPTQSDSRVRGAARYARTLGLFAGLTLATLTIVTPALWAGSFTFGTLPAGPWRLAGSVAATLLTVGVEMLLVMFAARAWIHRAVKRSLPFAVDGALLDMLADHRDVGIRRLVAANPSTSPLTITLATFDKDSLVRLRVVQRAATDPLTRLALATARPGVDLLALLASDHDVRVADAAERLLVAGCN